MYAIYQHPDGFFHARHVRTGRDLCLGEPLRSRHLAGMCEFLAFVGVAWQAPTGYFTTD